MADNRSDLPDRTLLFSYAANAMLDIDTWEYVDKQNVWLDRRAAVYRYAPAVCDAFDADRERLKALLTEPVLHADHDMNQVMRELADAAIGLLEGPGIGGSCWSSAASDDREARLVRARWIFVADRGDPGTWRECAERGYSAPSPGWPVASSTASTMSTRRPWTRISTLWPSRTVRAAHLSVQPAWKRLTAAGTCDGWAHRTTTQAARGSESIARACPFGTCSQRSPARAGPGCGSCAGGSKLEESRVRPAWDLALRMQLLEPVGIDAIAGETMYRLSDRVVARSAF